MSKQTEDNMQKQIVMCDGKPFEYDVIVPARELRPYVLKDMVSAASAQGTGLDHDLYILFSKGEGVWKIHGTDGIAHGLKPDEPVYVRFVNVEYRSGKLSALERSIRKALVKYSV